MLEFVREHSVIFIGVASGVIVVSALLAAALYYKCKAPKPAAPTEIQMADVNSLSNK